MATIINITGRNKTSRLKQKVKQLEEQGFKVFKSDDNLFFSGLVSKAVQERIHAHYDYIVNVPEIAGIWDGKSITPTSTKPKLSVVR